MNINKNIKTLLSLDPGDIFKFNNLELIVIEKFDGDYKFIELAYLYEVRHIFEYGPSILLKDDITKLVQTYDIALVGNHKHIVKHEEPENIRPDVGLTESLTDMKLLNIHDIVDGKMEIYDIVKGAYIFEQKIIIRKVN